MLTLLPIETLHKSQPDLVSEHFSNVRSTKLKTLLTFALAEMAGRTGVTSENLVGARMAFNIFLNLAEKPDEPKRTLPNKDLGQKSPPQPATETKKK